MMKMFNRSQNHNKNKARIQKFFYDDQNIEASVNILMLFGWSGDTNPTLNRLVFLSKMKSIFGKAENSTASTILTAILEMINTFDYATSNEQQRMDFFDLYNFTMHTNSCLNRARSTVDNYFANGAHANEIKDLMRISKLADLSFRLMFVGGIPCLVDDLQCSIDMCEHCECYWAEISGLTASPISRYYGLALFEQRKSKINFNKREFNSLPEYLREILYHRFDITLV